MESVLEAGRQTVSSNFRSYACPPPPHETFILHRLARSQGLIEVGGTGVKRGEDRAGSVGCAAGKLNWKQAFAEPLDLQPQKKCPHSTACMPTGHQLPGLSAISTAMRKQDSYKWE